MSVLLAPDLVPTWPGHLRFAHFAVFSLGTLAANARAWPSSRPPIVSPSAAHIVDRIIPSVPIRQWVLSLPFDVRARAAYDARFLTEIIRAFARALRERHRAWARSIALGDSEFAAITFVQRFGSSLNPSWTASSRASVTASRSPQRQLPRAPR